MKALIMNCSPVRTGATAEIVKQVSEQLSVKYSVIEHFYGHLEIETVGHLGLTSIEYKEDAELRKQEITEFCKNM